MPLAMPAQKISRLRPANNTPCLVLARQIPEVQRPDLGGKGIRLRVQEPMDSCPLFLVLMRFR